MFKSWEIQTHTDNTYIAGHINGCLQIAAEGKSVMLQDLEGKPYASIHADENYFHSLPAKYT